MEIEKTFVLPAPPARAWAMLLDPQLMAACVPGMQSVEVLSPTEYTALIQVKIAFITARFKLRTTIVEQRAPAYLRTEGTGEDKSVASALKQTSELFLTDLGEGRTELRTRVVVDVTGRLGTFGLSVMKTKADRMWEEFCANLVQRVGDGAAQDIAPTAPTATLLANAPVKPLLGVAATPPAAAAAARAPEAPQTAAPAPAPAEAAGQGVRLAPRTLPVSAGAPVATTSTARAGWWTRLLGQANGTVPAGHIHIELHKSGTVLTVDWPVQASAECAAWLREVTRD